MDEYVKITLDKYHRFLDDNKKLQELESDRDLILYTDRSGPGFRHTTYIGKDKAMTKLNEENTKLHKIIENVKKERNELYNKKGSLEGAIDDLLGRSLWARIWNL